VVSFFVFAKHGAEQRRKSLASSTSQGGDHDHLGNSNSAKCSFGRIRTIHPGRDDVPNIAITLPAYPWLHRFSAQKENALRFAHPWVRSMKKNKCVL